MDESQIDLRVVFGLLRRQFRLIAVTVVAVLAVAAIVVYSLTPIYASSALVLVDPSRKNLLDPEAQLSGTSADSSRIDSEVEILRSDNVLLKVIQAENLTADPSLRAQDGLRSRILTFLHLAEPELTTGEQALNKALSRLRNAVTVQRRGLTYLISIQVRSEDKKQAAQLANAVAKAYIEDQVASKVNSTLASRDILQARIIQARDAIAGSEGSFDAFINDNIERITQTTGRTDIAQMQSEIQQLVAARAQTTQLASTVQSSLDRDDFQAVVASLQSTALSNLERQREELKAKLDSSTADAPIAIDLKAQLASIDDRLRKTAVAEVTSMQDTISKSQSEETSKRQELRKTVLDSPLSTDVLTTLYELQKNSELARTQYQTLLSRTQDLDAQANLQVADSRIVSPALAPETPTFPNKNLIMALAGLTALILGVALAFLYENFIGGFTSEAQMATVLKTRVATAVPRQKGKSEKDSLANLMVTSPLSVFSESIRRLRAALDQSMRDKSASGARGGKVIMVCSTAPNEGKTTIALALTRSYALSGRTALLIDCDLRKPSVHRHLGIEPSQGLLEYLSAGNSDNLASIISRDDLTSATTIVGARRSDLPTDQLLMGVSFGRLIEAAKRSFDVVILDTPPVGPVVDGLFIAPFADAIVFVTRWASTSQLDAKQAVTSLMESKSPHAEIISIISQKDETRASYLRKYGGYYASTD